MTNVIEKKRPIAPVLKKMKVGDSEVYPLSQYSSVVSVKRRVNIQTGFNYSFKAKENCVIVTRTS
ncbi:MAG: hypothetical protein ACOCYO_07400 [Bacteroidota bacterium]